MASRPPLTRCGLCGSWPAARRICVELGLSPSALDRDLTRLRAKFGVWERSGIVGVAICRGHLQVPVMREVPDGFDEGLFDVLVRMARGRSNREIAAELYLSYDTVKTRVSRLLRVLGVSSREEAVVAGVACGVLRLVPVHKRERVSA